MQLEITAGELSNRGLTARKFLAQPLGQMRFIAGQILIERARANPNHPDAQRWRNQGNVATVNNPMVTVAVVS